MNGQTPTGEPTPMNGRTPTGGQSFKGEQTPVDEQNPASGQTPTGQKIAFTKKNILRGIATLAFLGLAGFWIWAFSPLPARGHPDNLDIPEFYIPAEQVCQEAKDNLDALPKIWTIDEPLQLGQQVALASRILNPMVDELRSLANVILDPQDAQIVSVWLDDWEVYLNDRQRFETKLNQGERAVFTYTARDSARIADIVDRFAQVNNMAACTTPTDI